MKIVLFPGVAVDKIGDDHKYFLRQIRNKLDCEGEIITWEIGHNVPVFNLPLKDTREYLCKVILDFQTVIVHATQMKVPDADLYLGHSAGSIIALAQKDKNCVTFGSPAALVECARSSERAIIDVIRLINSGNRKVLNIVNKYDVIAYPVNKPNVENYKFGGSCWNPLTYSPVSAHHSYWRSQTVINKIVDTVKNW